MSRRETATLALRTALATFCGMCCLLALVSSFATFEPVWRTIEAFRQWQVQMGVGGQGHCWLCGMSHAFRALWRGSVREALIDNPHSVALFALMLLGCSCGAGIAAKSLGGRRPLRRSTMLSI